MAQASHHWLIDPRPLRVVERAEPETVEAFLRRSGWACLWEHSCNLSDRSINYEFEFQTICVVAGKPVKRAEWPTRLIPANEDVQFISRPAGGGDGSALGLGAMIAVMAAAAVVSGPIGIGALSAAGLGGTAFTTAAGAAVTWASIAAPVAGATLSIGGSLLISSALAPKQNQPKSDPRPALVGQISNTQRPDELIPVGFGRTLMVPDLICSYSEFIGKDQRVYILLSHFLGRYDIESIRAEDTEVWNKVGGVTEDFEDVEIEIYEPGEEVTLFPFAVTTTPEVSNLELPGAEGSGWGDPTPWFPANAVDTLAKRLIVDHMFPAGLYHQNDKGELDRRSVQIKYEYREVNAAGGQIGSIQTLVDKTYNRKTREAIRDTFERGVEPGIYQVRGVRQREAIDASDGADQAIWFALRAHLVAPKSFPKTTTIAIAFTASDEIADTITRSWKTVATRILPVRQGNSWVEKPTRSIIDAYINAWSSDLYGPGRPLSDLDLDRLLVYRDRFEERGETFDHVFRGDYASWDAFKTILKVGRSMPMMKGSFLSMVRDEPRAVPTMLLTDRETLPDSFERKTIFQTEESADDLVAAYLNEETWQPDQLRVRLPGSESLRPTNVDVVGVVNRAQLKAILRFMAGENKWRRQFPAVETEYDGRILVPGDWVRVSPDVTGDNGEVAEVIDYDITARRLRVDPPPSWSGGGQWKVELRGKTGRPFGPVNCTQGPDKDIAILAAGDLADKEFEFGISLADVLDRAPGADAPTAVFQTDAAQPLDCQVRAFDPSGPRGKVSMVIDDPRVHAIDGTEVIPTPNNPDIKPPNRPIIHKIQTARIKQRGSDATIEAKWTEAFGAVRYQAQVTTDWDAEAAEADISWGTIYKGKENGFELPIDEFGNRFRVRALGKLPGPWVEAELDFPLALQIPEITLTRIRRKGQDGTREVGVNLAYSRPIDRSEVGLVVAYRKEGDTNFTKRQFRDVEDRNVDLFEGFHRNTEYEFKAKILYRGDHDGEWSDIETFSIGKTLEDPEKAVVPDLTLSWGVTRGDTGEKPQPWIRAAWAAVPGSNGVRRLQFRYVEQASGEEPRTESAKNDETRVWRTDKGIKKKTTYKVQARFIYDGDEPGNWCDYKTIATGDDFDASTAPVPSISLVASVDEAETREQPDVVVDAVWTLASMGTGVDKQLRGIEIDYATRKSDGSYGKTHTERKRFNPNADFSAAEDRTVRLKKALKRSSVVRAVPRFLFEDEARGNAGSLVTTTTPDPFDPSDFPVPAVAVTAITKTGATKGRKRVRFRCDLTINTDKRLRGGICQWKTDDEDWNDADAMVFDPKDKDGRFPITKGIVPGEVYDFRFAYTNENKKHGNWTTVNNVLAGDDEDSNGAKARADAAWKKGRKVSAEGFEVYAERDTGIVNWSAATFSYVRDDGTDDGVAGAWFNVSADDATRTTGVLYGYVNMGASDPANNATLTVQTTTNRATAHGPNNLVLWTYKGGDDLVNPFGRDRVGKATYEEVERGAKKADDRFDNSATPRLKRATKLDNDREIADVDDDAKEGRRKGDLVLDSNDRIIAGRALSTDAARTIGGINSDALKAGIALTASGNVKNETKIGGDGGDDASVVRDRADDPISRANAKTTRLQPGKLNRRSDSGGGAAISFENVVNNDITLVESGYEEGVLTPPLGSDWRDIVTTGATEIVNGELCFGRVNFATKDNGDANINVSWDYRVIDAADNTGAPNSTGIVKHTGSFTVPEFVAWSDMQGTEFTFNASRTGGHYIVQIQETLSRRVDVRDRVIVIDRRKA